MRRFKLLQLITILVVTALCLGGTYLWSGNCTANAQMCDIGCLAVEPPGGSTNCTSGIFHVTCVAYDADGNVTHFVNRRCPNPGPC